MNGRCFAAGASLRAHLESTPIDLGNFTAQADGTYSITVVMPLAASLGDHHVVVTGRGSRGDPAHRSSAPVTLVDSNTPLVRTGADVARLMWVAVVMVLIGVTMRARSLSPASGRHFARSRQR